MKTKLGIMLDPNPVYPNFDYRAFGDMFFDMRKLNSRELIGQFV